MHAIEFLIKSFNRKTNEVEAFSHNCTYLCKRLDDARFTMKSSAACGLLIFLCDFFSYEFAVLQLNNRHI